MHTGTCTYVHACTSTYIYTRVYVGTDSRVRLCGRTYALCRRLRLRPYVCIRVYIHVCTYTRRYVCLCKHARTGTHRRASTPVRRHHTYTHYTRSEEHTSELQSPLNLVCR